MSSSTKSSTANPSQNQISSVPRSRFDLAPIVAAGLAMGAVFCILSTTRAFPYAGLNALSNYKTVSSLFTAGLVVVTLVLIKKSMKNCIPASRTNSGNQNAVGTQQSNSTSNATSTLSKKPTFTEIFNNLTLELSRLQATGADTTATKQKLVSHLQAFYFSKWLPILEQKKRIEWKELVVLFDAQVSSKTNNSDLQTLFTRFRFPQSSWDSTAHINAFLVSLFRYYYPGTTVSFRPGLRIIMQDGDPWWKERESSKEQWKLQDLALYLDVDSESLEKAFKSLNIFPDVTGFYSKSQIEHLLEDNPATNSVKKIEKPASPRWYLDHIPNWTDDASEKLRMPLPEKQEG